MDRTVRVTLSLIAAGFEAGMAKAKASTDGLIGSLEKQKTAVREVSTSMMTGGAAILAGVGAATKAAMDWESAWAGVTKTVDGTDEQLRNLESSLRDMARTMPATHQEIAAVAEAAGQLGIAVDDVAEFTRVMIMLGETTNLTADEAATSFAQFMNIMGTAPGMVGNLGAALVELGNNGASTEADILRLSMRIAAAGKAAGMSEGDVLGFAAAMANVGIEAEAGGTALSQTFAQIDKAVRQGGESLDLLASISGMTASEFTRAWGQDAAGAAERFVLGLGDMQKRGESAKGALDELGMSGIRQSDTLMRLALSGEKFSDALRMGESAISSTSALLEEYGKRAQTTESQVQVAWNQIKDAAIDAGQVMLPVVAQIAGTIGDLTGIFASLPGPAKAAFTALAAITGGGLLAGGGLIKLVSGFLDLRSNVRVLREEFPRLDGAMGKVSWGKALAGVAALTVALIALAAAQEANREAFAATTTTADDLGATLLRTADAGRALDDAFTLDTRGLFSGVTREVDGLGDALDRVLSPTKSQGFEDFFNGLVTGGSAASQMRTQFEQLDSALAGMVRGGNAKQAADVFDQIAAAATAQGYEISDLTPLFGEYAGALRDSAGASGQAKFATELLAGGLDDATGSADAAVDAMMRLANAALQLSGSEMGLESAIDAATKAMQANGETAIENGTKLDINSEKGRANKQALDAIASSAHRVTAAQKESSASAEVMAASTARARAEFIAAARQMGLTEAAANDLADSYGLIPRTVTTTVRADGLSSVRSGLASLDDQMRALNGRVVRVDIRQTTRQYTVADGGMFAATPAGVVQTFASGGFHAPSIGSQQPQIRAAGGPGILWAEDGAGPWESFISGHWGKRRRSRLILEETARRLGGMVSWATPYADGGIRYAPNYTPPPIVGGRSSPTPNPSLDPAALRAALDGMRVDLDNGRLFFDRHYDARQSVDLRRQRAHTG